MRTHIAQVFNLFLAIVMRSVGTSEDQCAHSFSISRTLSHAEIVSCIVISRYSNITIASDTNNAATGTICYNGSRDNSHNQLRILAYEMHIAYSTSSRYMQNRNNQIVIYINRCSQHSFILYFAGIANCKQIQNLLQRFNKLQFNHIIE